MRLIDADTLIKDLSYLYTKNHIPVDMRAKETLSKIMEQPTAYDIDKVVEELELIRAKKTCNKEKCDTKEICRICVVDDAIEIVKHGGASDDVCEWKRDDMCDTVYKVCGGCFTNAYQKDFKYCPYCGKKIKIVGELICQLMKQ